MVARGHTRSMPNAGRDQRKQSMAASCWTTSRLAVERQALNSGIRIVGSGIERAQVAHLGA